MKLLDHIHGAEVTAGPVPERVDDAIVEKRFAELDAEVSLSRTQAVCRLPGGGRFWVRDGRQVVVEAGAEDDPVPWLHATVGSLVLAQQGRFALHGNVVDVDGTAVVIAGLRRAGKSTTSLALMARGHRLITDDVATLDLEDDTVVHRPGGRPIHIDPEGARRLGVSVEGATPVVSDPGKVALANPPGEPVEVRAIVLLRAREDAHGGVELVRLTAAEGTRAVHMQSYRRTLLHGVWRTELFAWAAAVAARVPVWLLARPEGAWTTDEVCERIERLEPA